MTSTGFNKGLSTLRNASILFSLILMSLQINGQANMPCTGICNDPGEFPTPCYEVTLPAPDATLPEFPVDGSGSCCNAIPDNQNCAQLTINYQPLTAGLVFTFDGPCSVDLYDGSGGCDGLVGPFDACDPYCPDLDPMGGTIEILLCKPGSFVQSGTTIEAIPEIVVTTPNSNDNNISGCQADFTVFGLDPGQIVSYSPMTYITCATADCQGAIFEYTGAPVTDCGGLDLTYDINLPGNDCEAAVIETRTVTVFPSIEGTMDVVCGMGELSFVFTPDNPCPDLVFQWFDQANNLLPETSNVLTVPENLEEYRLEVSRPGATACTPFVLTRIANCCQPPVFLNCPGDRVVTVLDPTCAEVEFPTPAATDGGCGPVNVVQTMGPASGSNFPVGTTLIEFTATNADGQSSVCQFNITVVVSPDLTLICPTDIITCSEPGTCLWTGMGLDPFATPPCPPGADIELTYSITGATNVATTPGVANGVAFNLGTSFVTYTLTDNLNPANTEICVFGVTVNDCEAPILTCPADEIDVECGTEDVEAWANSASALDVGLCSVATVEYFLQVSSEQCGEAQLDQYLFIATDEAGNTSTCVAFYGTVDTQAPMITTEAMDVTVECDGSNNAAEILAWLNNNGGAEATEDCGPLYWTNDYGTVTNTCGSSGSVTVTFTATDGCGNSETTQATLTINDTTAPAWEILPADITFSCDDTSDPMNQIQNWLATVGGAEAEDDCSLVIYSNNYVELTGGCSDNTGSATVTFTATDACGNSITADADVTVVDNVAPVITTPAQDSIVNCDGSGNGADLASWLANNGNAQAADLCSEPLTWANELLGTDQNCGGTTTSTYAFTATDECGNTSIQTIAQFIIVDNTPPSITAMPQDTVVECDGSGNIADRNSWLGNNGGAMATDECGGSVFWGYVLVNDQDSCGFTGRNTYRFVVVDECGNTSSAEADFVIVDMTSPSIDTEAMDITVECDGSNNASEILDWLNDNGGAEASDECGNITWSNDYGDINNMCGTSGDVTVTFTATDDCGNTSTTSAVFTINDTTAPVWEILPADLTVECDGTNDPLGQIDAWLNNAGGGEAEDSCSLVQYTFDNPGLSGGCSNGTGDAVVTFTASDACGNFTTATANLSVVDNTPPEIETPAQDTIVECDGAGNGADLLSWLNNNGWAVAFDLCSEPLTWSNELVSTVDGCGGTSTATYAFTATDECGNVSLETLADFIIVDNTPPVISTTPTDLTVECDGAGNVDDLNNWLNNNGNGAATDVCDSDLNLTWEYDLVAEVDSCSITGTNTYRFTVYDDCGNSSTAEADFVIRDITAPVITVEAMDLTVDCDGGNNSAEIENWLNNNAGAEATEECSDITWTNDFGEFTDECGTTGEVTVTFTATDGCGNFSTTTATFTINDDIAPYWEIAPMDLTLECDGSSDPLGQIQEWLDNAGGGEAEDSCSLVFYSYDFPGITGGCSEFTGDAVVTFTATDACGNSVDTTAVVTIVDNVPPNITSPAQDTIVECDGMDNQAELTSWLGNIAGAMAEDSCSMITWNTPVAIDTIEGCGNTRTFVYSFTADDECDNESAATIASFIIIDTTPPEITTAPADLTVECDGLGNVGDLNTWLMANGGGGEANDICEGDLELTWEYDLVSEVDSCSITGRNTYRFTVYDNCGNSSTAEADFVVRDITPPVITVEAMDLTVDCDGANNSAEIENWLNNNGGAEATEECSDITWTNDFGEFTDECGTTGEVTVTFTATDGCGNFSTTTATFTINDDIAPYWEIAPMDLTLECDGSSDPLGQIQEWLDNAGGGEAEDSCSLVFYTYDFPGITGGCSEFTGDAVVTFTATDACGNSVDTTAIVTIVDNVPPNITSPAQDTIVECDGMDNPDELASWLGNIAGAMAEDSCSMITWNTPVAIDTIEGCGNTRTFVYSFTADDECDNESAATIASFIIIDTTPPEITTAPADLTVECDGLGNVDDLNDWLMTNGGGGEAEDVCEGTLNLTWEYDLVSEVDSCTITGRNTYRFTVYDNCGNSSTAEADFVVRDITPPVITVEAMDITVDCDGASNSTEIEDWLNNNGGAEATEECSDVTWTNDFGEIIIDCGASGEVTVTFTATDGCGNFSTTAATFTIQDTIDPYWEIAPMDLTLECDGTADPLGQIQEWLDNAGGGEAEDSCSLVFYTYDFPGISGGCSEFTGSAVVTFTATDICGNFTDTTAVVTIVDNVPPNITSPAQDTIVECDGMDNPDELASWLGNIAGAMAEDSCSMITWNTPVAIDTIEGCGNTRTFVYSFTADDECENESAATIASFIIIDTTPPEITTAPADITVECDGLGNVDELNDWLANNGGVGEADDICEGDLELTWEYDLVSEVDSCSITGRNTYRFTVYDNCGNSSTAEADFVVRDITPPVITVEAMDLTVDCDGANNSAEIENWLNDNGGAEATEECSDITWTNDFGEFTDECGTSGEVTVTFTATDGCGNFSTTTATFTINDDIAPYWEIPPMDLTLECDGTADPLGQIQEWLDNAGGGEAEDSCSLVFYTYDFPGITGGCSEFTGDAVVTFTATDACGNSVDTTAIVTIVDNVPPNITSPALDTIVECDGMDNVDELASWLGNIAGAMAEDSCSMITWNTPIALDTIEGCGNTRTFVYAFSADDECGNESATTVANFIIFDTTPPEIETSPMDMVVECDGLGNEAELDAWLTSNGGGIADDICEGELELTWEYDLVAEEDSCSITGRNTYRFTVYDNCGNSSTAEADFVIRDITAPVITVEAMDITVDCDGANNSAEIEDWLNSNGGAEATEECSDITWTNDFGEFTDECGTTGEVTVTFTATDGCGNFSTTTATFTINDDIAPYWEILPMDLTLECDGSSDPLGQIQEWLDNAGGGEAEDSCSLVFYTYDYPGITGGCSEFTGDAVVTFTATDACGNSVDATAVVTIVDNVPPAIVSPAQDTIVECNGMDNQDELMSWLGNIAGAVAEDSCSLITWNLPVAIDTIEGCGDTRTFVYSFTADDECGNESAATIASFIIVDETAPTIETEASDTVVDCDGNGNQDELNAWLSSNAGATASDICNGEEPLVWEYDLVAEEDSCSITGRNTYRFTVYDDCGNSSTTEADFVIRDITAPVITVEAMGITVDCDGANNSSEILDWLNNNGGAEATEECSDITWSNDYGDIDNDCGSSGEVTVTFTATDGCGNSASTTATFTINDDTAPYWEIEPADLTIECNGDEDPLMQIQAWLDTAGGGEAEDSCSLVTYMDDFDGLSGGCSEFTGSAEVTFTATDACGNAATATATVTVVDNALPYFTIMAQDTIVECDGMGNADALQEWLDDNGGAEAEDQCSEPLTWNNFVFETIEGCGGTSTVTYAFSATDACGNESPLSLASFIIQDTTPPAFTVLPSGANVDCDDEEQEDELEAWLNNNGGGEAEDICSEPLNWEYHVIEVSGCGGTVITTYRFTVYDDCGNSATADAIFGIGTDEEGEVELTGGEDLFVECDQSGAGNDDELIGWLNNNGGLSAGAGDCIVLNWTNDFDPANWVEECGDTRYVDVIFTANDGCGTEASDTLRFGIVDTTPPVFSNCPRPPIIVDAPSGWCEAFVNYSPVAAEDNCGDVTINQIDDTGLSTGDLFPVGLTILEFEAVDECGNADTCQLKIIVNDFHNFPSIACPGDVSVGSDLFKCGAEVDGIAPTGVDDNCPDNVAVSYTVTDPTGAILSCGFEDASGTFFDPGVNTVTYKVQDQPILLITEVIEDGSFSGVEITNFGPASLDISCLNIVREGVGDTTFVVPNGTVVGVGEVYTQNFDIIGLGVPVGYYISFVDKIIDGVALNGYQSQIFEWSGNLTASAVQRIRVCDTDTADDWFISTDCNTSNFGFLNEGLPTFTDNGTLTSLQSEEPNMQECSFTVTVEDDTDPFCADLDDIQYFANDLPATIIANGCTESTILVNKAVTVWDVNVIDLNGLYPNMLDLTITLTSPEGTEVVLFNNLCQDEADFDVDLDDQAEETLASAECGPLGNDEEFQPIGLLKDFFGEDAEGIWTLKILNSGDETGQLDNWILELASLLPYSQEDVELENDPGFCGAQYNWVAPIIGDNCCANSTITVEYSSDDDINVPPSGDVVSGGTVSAFFEVGTTTVKYTLDDGNGNMSMCSFDVTVVDVEAPMIDASSCQDVTINLDPGECSIFTSFQPADLLDNCEIEGVEYTPDPADGLPLGDTEVTLIVTDASGNTSSCTFTITVIDFDPDSDQLTCNDNVNVSLGPDCEAFITPDMILEGGPYGCLDNFCVTLTDPWGEVIGSSLNGDNKVTTDHVGMEITVEICTSCDDDDNCCWGTINVEQKQLPQVDCPSDTSIVCNASIHPDNIGYPVLRSCEEELYMNYYDEFTDFGGCSNPRAEIERRWIVEDESGNVVECFQIITIEDFDLNTLEYPEDIGLDNALDCFDVENDPSLLHPDNTGYPTLNGIVISETGEGLCMHSWNWDDQILYNCEGSYEILRKWIIRDMCEPIVPGENPVEYYQVIKILDTTGPEFSTCPDDLTISTDVWNCYASIDLSEMIPEVTDLCGGVSDLQVFVNQGTVIQDINDPTNVQLTNLLQGDHLVKIKAKDFCSNFSLCEFTITVEDQVPPVVICDDELRVSLTTDGTARVYPQDVDEGSFDNCDPLYMQVYRTTADCGEEFTTPGPYVEFCCEDLMDSITLVLRVWDDGDNNGIPGTEGDNYSECWTTVTVEEKIPPQIICPPDMTINCLDDWQSILDGDGTAITGTAEAFATCPISDPEYVVNGSVDDCGYGQLTLTWTVSTSQGNTQGCVQRITVEPEIQNQLTCDRISFPAGSLEAITYGANVWCEVNDNENDDDDDQPAIEITDCGDFEITAPELDNDLLCSAIGITMSADTFNFAGGACKKIIVHWEVIDHCVFDENFVDPVTGEIDPFHTDNGYFEFFAEYDVFDNEAPEIMCTEDIVINCADNFTGPITGQAVDNCTDPSEFGWSWAFDYGADGSIDYLGTGNEIFASSLGLDFIELGEHRIIWSVNDGCLNNATETCIINITDEDTKAPTPYCYDGIATAVMDQVGEVSIWASDYDAGSTDDCTAQENLVFSFSGDEIQPGMTFNCDSLDNGISQEFELNVWVWDEAGNRDFCTVTLLVQDNVNVCPDDSTQSANIAGLIMTEVGLPVNEVEVELGSTLGEYPKFNTTAEDGEFVFGSNPLWYAYLLSAAKDFDYLNGVSTLDIVLIQKHVLGTEVLDSPYKIIAADANNDEKVSAIDLVVLRKLVLGIIPELPDNESWRFVDEDYEFSDPLSPFPFPDSIEISQLEAASMDNDFIGVKIGDVNQSAEVARMGRVKSRSDFEMIVETKTILREDGKMQVDFFSTNTELLHGFQFTLNMKDHQFVEFESGLVQFTNQHFTLNAVNEGLIPVSWNSINPISMVAGQRLFSVIYQPSGDKDIEFDSELIDNEVYIGEELISGKLKAVSIPEEQLAFEMMQNTPNPFSETSIISFVAPEEGEFILTISNTLGKKVYELDVLANKGLNQIEIDASIFESSGTYLYRLESENNSETKSLIFIGK